MFKSGGGRGRPRTFSGSGGPSTSFNHTGASSATSKELPEGPRTLYPALTIPEPYFGEKKQNVMRSILKYKTLIDDVRALHAGQNFEPSGFFKPPSFAPKRKKPKDKPVKKVVIEKSLEDQELAKEGEDPDTEDEQTAEGGTAKKKPADDDAEEVEEAKDSDDEDAQNKSDSDVDDYTAAAGFDDDEMNFEEDAGEAENDNHIF